MVAITSSGRRVRSSQVNRSTVQPPATSRFCRVRSRWNRSPVECQALPVDLERQPYAGEREVQHAHAGERVGPRSHPVMPLATSSRRSSRSASDRTP